MGDEDKRIQTAGRNVIAWFEMPVRRLDLAQTFYQNVFGFDIVTSPAVNPKYGIIKGGATNPDDIYGIFVEYPDITFPLPPYQIPSFRAMDQADYCAMLDKVVQNGGTVVSQNRHEFLGVYAKCTDELGTQFIIHPLVFVNPCPAPHPQMQLL